MLLVLGVAAQKLDGVAEHGQDRIEGFGRAPSASGEVEDQRVAAHAGDAVRAAAAAATAGARATAGMVPRRGRSSYLGERAVGHPDPGAEAVAVWLGALAQPSDKNEGR